MKCYRNWQLFRRRQRQQSFILILGFFTTLILGSFLLNQVFNPDDITIIDLNTLAIPVSSLDCHCSKSSLVVINHGECFFDKLVCHPGFIGNQCEIKLKNEV